jgi:hypothetical protein
MRGATVSTEERRVIGVETCPECGCRWQVSARGRPANGTEFFKCDCGNLLKTWTGEQSFVFDRSDGASRPSVGGI